MKNTKTIWGIVIIAAGIILLLYKIGYVEFLQSVWTLALFIPGVFLWILFFINKRKFSGILIPGTTLLAYGFFFIYNQYTGYSSAKELAFIFTFGPALGFFATYFLAVSKERGLLYPAWILTIISVIIFFTSVGINDWVPIIVILFGSYLIIKKNNKNQMNNKNDAKNNKSSISDKQGKQNVKKGNNVFGIILIVIGLLWLLNNLGYNWAKGIWLPAVMIIFGAYLIYKNKSSL